MANHANTGMNGKKKKPMIKIASLSIAGILVASIVTALSLSSGNANLFSPQSQIIVDPHDSRIVMHTHVQLEIIAGGMKAGVPANIGIDPKFYKDHSLDAYGLSSPQTAPIHTHGNEGLLHIESTVLRDYTMGDFLNIWGVRLDDVRTISMTVDGKSVPGYRNHILKDGQKITLEIGV